MLQVRRRDSAACATVAINLAFFKRTQRLIGSKRRIETRLLSVVSAYAIKNWAVKGHGTPDMQPSAWQHEGNSITLTRRQRVYGGHAGLGKYAE